MKTVHLRSFQVSAKGALKQFTRVCSLPAWLYSNLTHEAGTRQTPEEHPVIQVLGPAGLVACCSYVKRTPERSLWKLGLV